MNKHEHVFTLVIPVDWPTVEPFFGCQACYDDTAAPPYDTTCHVRWLDSQRVEYRDGRIIDLRANPIEEAVQTERRLCGEVLAMWIAKGAEITQRIHDVIAPDAAYFDALEKQRKDLMREVGAIDRKLYLSDGRTYRRSGFGYHGAGGALAPPFIHEQD
jgi:ribosomal protein S16